MSGSQGSNEGESALETVISYLCESPLVIFPTLPKPEKPFQVVTSALLIGA